MSEMEQMRASAEFKVENKDIVLSDSHPFHLECMRQARIYCPHMVNTTDNEYIIGEYSKILYNTKDHIEVI